MAARRPNAGISYAELAEYEAAVDAIRKAGVEIAKDARYYVNENGMMVSDGEIFTSHVRNEIAKMQKAIRKIDAMSKKYGRS